jgi:hypothetical protein
MHSAAFCVIVQNGSMQAVAASSSDAQFPVHRSDPPSTDMQSVVFAQISDTPA